MKNPKEKNTLLDILRNGIFWFVPFKDPLIGTKEIVTDTILNLPVMGIDIIPFLKVKMTARNVRLRFIPSAPPLVRCSSIPLRSNTGPVLSHCPWMMTLPVSSFHSSSAAAPSRSSHHASHRACRCVPYATGAQ